MVLARTMAPMLEELPVDTDGRPRLLEHGELFHIDVCLSMKWSLIVDTNHGDSCSWCMPEDYGD